MAQEIYDSAIVLFDKALELDPYDIEARYMLALSCEKCGEKNKAINEYKKVIAQNPDHIEAKNNLNMLTDVK
jgi:Flp pilus assembly protein TadD